MRVLIVLAGLLCACSRDRPKGPAATDLSTPEGRDQALALLPPGGGQKIDDEILKLQSFARLRSDKVEAWITLGNAWVRKARDTASPRFYANADACVSQALRLRPDDQQSLALRGLILMNDHRFEEARQLMAGLVRRSPDLAIAWGTLSDALIELGRTDEATAAAQRMMDLKPNLPSYSRAAHLQWLRGDVASARDTLRLAIDAGGGSLDVEPKCWVIVQAAQVFWNEGDVDGADAGFDQALTLLRDYPPALIGKGRVALARGDGKAAAGYLDRAYAETRSIEAGWLMGDARSLAGDAAGAEAIWSDIMRRGPVTDPRTLAQFLATKNRSTDLALRLALAERDRRDDQYTEDTVAWALYRSGRMAEALKSAERSTALNTRDARLWFHAGAIRLANGEIEKGREQIRRALQLNPYFDVTGAHEARTLLAGRMARGEIPVLPVKSNQ